MKSIQATIITLINVAIGIWAIVDPSITPQVRDVMLAVAGIVSGVHVASVHTTIRSLHRDLTSVRNTSISHPTTAIAADTSIPKGTPA